MEPADSIPLSNYESVIVPGTPANKITVKSFVETKGLKFPPGQSFYQLAKAEEIQLTKKFFVERLSEPGTLWTGKSALKALKINENRRGGKFNISEDNLKEFKVFVQSTSVVRNLIGGTVFLYQKENTTTPSGTVPTPSGTVPASSTTSVQLDGPSPPKVQKLTTPSFAAGSGGDKSGGKVEIVISFDTTGSMYPCLSTVRSVIRDTLKRLTTQIPTIKIGIIAHGDYDTSYTLKAANDFKLCGKDKLEELIKFVNDASPTGGCTFPECYEFVLRETRKFDWSADANKSLILIGDAIPHSVDDYWNKDQINWREEAEELKNQGIRVYSVQALDRAASESFWMELARLTMGFHLRLHQFSSISDFLTAVCFREGDAAEETGHLAQFEEEVSSAGKMVLNLKQLFDQLQGRPQTVSAPAVTTTGNTLVPVSPSRFQVLRIDKDQAIKEFAEARGLVFKAGRGFYEFTKPEAVSDRKEVVLMDRQTGEFYTGWTAARELSGIDAGKPNVKQRPQASDKYTVFIQSTSYNRKLIAGQQFLYEVDQSQ